MIDSHCHLADRKFSSDIDAVLQRADEHGVDTMICIADDIEESKKCLKLAEKYDQFFCTVGVHPHDAENCLPDGRQGVWDEAEKEIRRLLLSSHKVKAVGEIGLDYHYMNSPKDVQQVVFEKQLLLAKELEFPAVVHCRDAVDDVRSLIEKTDVTDFVIHCCTEEWSDILWVIDRGGMLSFTGIATYPKSEDIRDTIRQCPLERLMVETDAPYLAPVPHRGRRNEPMYVVEVAKTVAEVKGVSLAEVDQVTTKNAVEFFGL